MTHRIGESGADVNVLLVKLAGSERAGRAQALWNLFAAAVIGLAVPAFLSVLLTRERTFDSSWWLLLALALAAPVFALELLLQALTTHVITPESVSRVSPLRLGSWRIDRADIYAIDLEVSAHGPIIHIAPRSGRKRSVLLLSGFHERLSHLYPEIGTPGSKVELSPRLGRFVYTLLAVVVATIVVLMMVLANKALITWE